jgi:hypothetical protein
MRRTGSTASRSSGRHRRIISDIAKVENVVSVGHLLHDGHLTEHRVIDDARGR